MHQVSVEQFAATGISVLDKNSTDSMGCYADSMDNRTLRADCDFRENKELWWFGLNKSICVCGHRLIWVRRAQHDLRT